MNHKRGEKMTINEIQDQIIEEFSIFDDWMDKYAYLIEIGNGLDPIDESKKKEQNLIKGCQSKVWIDARFRDGKIFFDADSDAIIVKGIVALLLRTLSGQSPKDIMDSDLYFIEKIGLNNHLSPTRSNGLVAMVKQMKLYGLAFNAKNA
ncbi:SufE family protein [Saccharicrinis sp. FJH62]|uniref:SufE family protein n=1 Tax=Saccharicrinis sp. FJH62 TaxID=3344657 RepID=UPI0035D4D459